MCSYDLGALGLQLWNGIKDRQSTDRAAAATNFAQEASWSTWEAITEDSMKQPQKPATVQPAVSGKSSSSSESSPSTQPSDSNQPAKPAKPSKPQN